jgi:hypothetical protein
VRKLLVGDSVIGCRRLRSGRLGLKLSNIQTHCCHQDQRGTTHYSAQLM